MTLSDRITTDLKAAMKSGDALRKAVLRGVLAGIKTARIDKELSEDDVIALVQKEIKAQHETIADAETAGRDEMVAEARSRIEILNEYLPEQLSDDDLLALVRATIAEVGATSPKQQGQVMAALMPAVRGKADGKAVAALVSRLLKEATG